jgi:hypothetical protein
MLRMIPRVWPCMTSVRHVAPGLWYLRPRVGPCMTSVRRIATAPWHLRPRVEPCTTSVRRIGPGPWYLRRGVGPCMPSVRCIAPPPSCLLRMCLAVSPSYRRLWYRPARSTGRLRKCLHSRKPATANVRCAGDNRTTWSSLHTTWKGRWAGSW